MPSENDKALGVPVLSLRFNRLYFPGSINSFPIGRAENLQSLEAASAEHQQLALLIQRDPLAAQVNPGDLYSTGSLTQIISVRPFETMKHATLEVLSRIAIDRVQRDGDGVLRAWFKEWPIQAGSDAELQPAIDSLLATIQALVSFVNLPEETIPFILIAVRPDVHTPSKVAEKLVATVIAYLSLGQIDHFIPLEKCIPVFEADSLQKQLQLLTGILSDQQLLSSVSFEYWRGLSEHIKRGAMMTEVKS